MVPLATVVQVGSLCTVPGYEVGLLLRDTREHPCRDGVRAVLYTTVVGKDDLLAYELATFVLN